MAYTLTVWLPCIFSNLTMFNRDKDWMKSVIGLMYVILKKEIIEYVYKMGFMFHTPGFPQILYLGEYCDMLRVVLKMGNYM